jgi:tetratricopeptide (TPR) repeat protein
MRLYLADRDVRSRNYKAAVAKYQAVLAQQPDNGAALNNLAWVLGELNDPGAIGYAERALKLDSLNVAALDTLGVLLLKQGDAGKGVEHLERATKLAPARPDIRLHYAKGLIKIGRKDAARSELVALQNVKEEFAGRSEVAELLKAL